MTPNLLRAGIGVILLLPIAAAAQDPLGFNRGLRAAHKNMALGRFAASRGSLLTLLRRHREQPYVFVQRAILLEDFRRCAFYIAHPTPTPRDSVSGRLVDFRAESGKVVIEYSPSALLDFDEPVAPTHSERRLAWHPMVFQGPYSITVKGRTYKETVHQLDRTREIRLGFNLHVCGGESGHLEIAFGNRTGTRGTNDAQLIVWSENRIEVLQKTNSMATVGEPFTIRVDMGRVHVKAFYKNKLLFKVKRGKREFGRFAIEGSNFDTLTARGRIHPGWIEGRIDHQVQMLLDDFNRNYEAKEVPDWLIHSGIKSRRSFNPSQAWPADAGPRHRPMLGDMVWFFEQEQYEEGLAYLADVQNLLPENTQAYLRARFHFELDEIDMAVRYCEQLVRDDPEFLTGRQLRAELIVRRGQGVDAAVADYRDMITDHPKARGLYRELAVLLVKAGRAKEAGEVLRNAVRATGNHRELGALQRMLDCVIRGPTWAKTFEHRSRRYLVRSNIDKAICIKAARMLEAAHTVYEQTLGRAVRKAKDPYRVFLFKGQTGYERFCRDILGERDTHTAGLYSATLKQLLVWNLPDGDQMLQTIRHEGFHQYLDSLVHDAPAWVNEGLAEYFQVAPARGVVVRADHLRTLKRKGIMASARFIRMPWKAFYRGSNRNYAQAWATVHFLRHGDAPYRGILPRLLQSLAAGKSPKAAVRDGFAGVDLAALGRGLTAHVEQLGSR